MDARSRGIKASTTALKCAEIQTVLQNAADRVNRADPGCDYSIFVKSAVQAKGWPATQATATYQYYSAGTDALAINPGKWMSAQTAPLNGPGPTKFDACGPSGMRTARLIQLVTISITDLSGHTRTMQVMKSDV